MSEITDEMVEAAMPAYEGLSGSVATAEDHIRSIITAALAARPIEAGSVKIQRYELTPHGTLKEAADGWWTSADAAEAAIAEREERIERLKKALREVRDDPCMDPEGNSAIARAALQQEGE